MAVPYVVFSPELGSNGEFDYLQKNEDKAKLTTMIIERYGEEGLHSVGDTYVRQAKEHQTLNTSKRMNRLLKCLVKKSEESLIGSKLHINSDDEQHALVVYNDRIINTDEYAKSVKTYYEALAWSEATTLQEFHFMIKQLQNAGLLEIIQTYYHGTQALAQGVQGYERLRSLVAAIGFPVPVDGAPPCGDGCSSGVLDQAVGRSYSYHRYRTCGTSFPTSREFGQGLRDANPSGSDRLTRREKGALRIARTLMDK